MRSRLALHEELVNILGSRFVYFQPPESIKLKYPCIIYERRDISNTFADNDQYLQPRQYQVTIIDADPDSEIVDRMSKFQMSKFVRHLVVDNLNHDIFNVYY